MGCVDRTPPANKRKNGSNSSSKGSKVSSVGQTTGVTQTRSNSQRQAAAAAGPADLQASPPSDAPASRSAGGDQSQQLQGREKQSQQQQQQQQQAQQQQGQQQQTQQGSELEEGEVSTAAQLAELLETVKTIQEQLTCVTGDHLVLSENLSQYGSELAQVKQQLKARKQQPPEPESAGVEGGLTDRFSSLEATTAQQGQQLSGLHTQAAQACRLLAAMGVSDESDARDLQSALAKGAQAYTEHQQLREEQQQQQQRVTQLEARISEQEGRLSSVRTSLGQLQQRAGLEDTQVEFVAWGPTEMTPDQVVDKMASAAGVSVKAFTGAHRAWSPKAAAASSSGGNAAAAAAAGSSSGRQQLSLYVLCLSHRRYLHACLGGKCRLTLRSRQVPIWVDAALSEEERAQRRSMTPLAKQLRADGVLVRWKGAWLEQQVTRADGRKQWREVNPLPPPDGGDAAEQEVGGGAGDAQ